MAAELYPAALFEFRRLLKKAVLTVEPMTSAECAVVGVRVEVAS